MTSSDQTATQDTATQDTATQDTATRSKGPSITLAICLAAGIAAGIGLARPGAPSNATSANATSANATSANATSANAAPANGTQASAETGAQPAAGYGSSGQQQEPSATPQVAPPAAIDISGFAFGNPITVAAGSAITVTNSDGAAHTLTSNDGLFDTGNLGGGAATTIAAPGQPGTYSFFCSIHPSMQGSVTVAQ